MSELELSAASESSPRSVPRRVPRLVSCLIKGPLGCLFFLIGAAAVSVLLLPPVGGRLSDKLLEKWFAERHMGSLELADAWVGSLYGPQRIDSVILRDPEDDEVLRASLRAPALTELLGHGVQRGGHYGPVEIRIASLRIVQARDGSTNLSRALSPRPREESGRDARSGLDTDRPLEIGLEVWIERLRYADALGHEGTLDGSVLRGKLFWGPYETRLVLEGGPDPGASDSARGELELVWHESDPTWPRKAVYKLENAPSVLAGLVCAAVGPLVPFAGTTLDELAWERDGTRVELKAEDEDAELALRGSLEKGAIAGDESSASLTLPCSDGRSGQLLSFLVPLLDAPECLPSEQHELRLRRCHWPLDGAWGRLAGELELETGTVRAWLAPRVRADLVREAPLQLLLEGLRAPVRDGVLEYAHLRLAMEEGWLQLDGTLDLASGVVDAHVTGESQGASLDLGRWAGTHGELTPQPQEPPSPPGPAAVEAATPVPVEEE